MKQIIRTLVGLTLFFAIKGYSSDQKKLKPVVLQLKWRHQFNFAGYYAAKEKGYFEQAGLDVTIKEGLPGVNFIDEVVQGRADYGIEMPDLLLARAEGKPIVVLAAIFQHSPYILLTKASSGITNPQDAVGKTIMIRESSAAELRSMFINEGVNLADIKIVPHTWNIDDLVKGDVDGIGAYLTDQPYLLQQKNIPQQIIRPRSYGIDFYGDCLFTSEKKIADSPEQVRRFRDACIKGWDYAMRHPQELVDIIKSDYKSPYSKDSMLYEYSVIKDEIMLPDLVEIGHMNPGRWRHILETYKQLGMLSGDVQLDKFIYNPKQPTTTPLLAEPWVRISIMVVAIIVLAALGAAFILYYFNKRLKREVYRQTRETAKKEEQFRALFNNYFQLTGLLDTDGRIIMINTPALELIGKQQDDVKGKFFWDTPWWEHSSNLQEKLKGAISSARAGEFVRFDTTHLTPDGDTHYIDFSIKPVKDEAGNIVNLLPEGRDITEKKLTEERYQKLYDQAGDAIIVIKDGVIMECNQKTLELFECDRDWIIGSTPKDLTIELEGDDFDTNEAENKLAGALVKRTVNFECRLRTAKENTFVASVNYSRFMFGKNNYIQAIIRDVSENKQNEEKLRLSQKMEAIGTLAGGIAHDFNNILAGILGFNELALREVEPGSKLEVYLKEMLKSGDRAKELVDQILTFSRRSAQEKRPIILGMIVQESMKLLRATIPATIELRSDIKSTAPVYADATQMHQVIMNLCTNAYHALEHASGKMSVSLSDISLSEKVAFDKGEVVPGDYVQLQVTDTGAGMAPETIQKAFEPYYTTKEMGKGTGLGLSIVHGIVTDHKGYITIESTLGEGTTITILLPVTAETPAQQTPIREAGDVQGHGEHILFVDDEEAITSLSAEALKNNGYTVTTFNSAKDALEACKAAPDSFDLVITDMTMPEMTGQDMVKEIFAIRKEIPVIMCSGYNETVNKVKALELGISEYLLKPVSTANLLATIRDVLSTRS